jgi:hypothetical protein
MLLIEMPRKDKGFRLDTRIIEALAKVKELTGKTANAYVEELLLMNLKSLGIIPTDIEPLPEARGGKRDGAGKPKKVAADDSTADKTTDSSDTDPESLK